MLGAAGPLSRTDLLANVVAYVPLGLLYMRTATWASARGASYLVRHAATGVLCAALLSLSLELLQSCQTARVSSVFDWVANVCGAALGVSAWLLLRASAAAMTPRRAHASGEGRLRVFTAAVVVVWIVSQTAPWVFAVDVGTVRSNLSFLRHWNGVSSLDLWQVLRHAGAWLSIACACRLVADGASRAVVAVGCALGASLLLQVLLEAHAPLSFEELAGMGLASTLAVPVMVHTGDRPRPARWAVGLLCGALLTVLAYELRPDPAAEATTRAFSWWPRVGLGGLRGALDYALLFGWFGLTVVVAARWSDVQGRPRARRLWPALAVLVMLGLEAAQTGIPGRGPDLSAPLFTALAVLATAAILGDAGDTPA